MGPNAIPGALLQESHGRGSTLACGGGSMALSANAANDSLNGCRMIASDQADAFGRQRDQMLSQRSQRHHNWCRSVRCSSSSGRRKAASWRRVPPDLRGKYGYHHTTVLQSSRLDAETRLAKGNSLWNPCFVRVLRRLAPKRLLQRPLHWRIIDSAMQQMATLPVVHASS